MLTRRWQKCLRDLHSHAGGQGVFKWCLIWPQNVKTRLVREDNSESIFNSPNVSTWQVNQMENQVRFNSFVNIHSRQLSDIIILVQIRSKIMSFEGTGKKKIWEPKGCAERKTLKQRIFTHLEDFGEKPRTNPLAGEVIEACQTREGTDEGSVGGRTHPAHLEPNNTRTNRTKSSPYLTNELQHEDKEEMVMCPVMGNASKTKRWL